MSIFYKIFIKRFSYKKLGLSKVFTSRLNDELNNFEALSEALTDIMVELGKKVILMIDEVDMTFSAKEIRTMLIDYVKD